MDGYDEMYAKAEEPVAEVTEEPFEELKEGTAAEETAVAEVEIREEAEPETAETVAPVIGSGRGRRRRR